MPEFVTGDVVESTGNFDLVEEKSTKLIFRFFYDPDTNRAMITLRENAPISDEDAETLGISYNDKGKFWWLDCPRADFDLDAFDRIKDTFAKFNYEVEFEYSRDAAGNIINPHNTYDVDGYKLCAEARTIAQELIPEHHPKLAAASILYVLRDYVPRADANGKYTAAKASKIPAFSMWATGYDFAITICMAVWEELNASQKRALIDHELSHCTRNARGKWATVSHDIEDFYAIIERHGDWSGQVNRVVRAMRDNNNTPAGTTVGSVTERVVERIKEEKASERAGEDF